MTEYKLNNAIAQSLPGNFEDHYGYKCQVRSDGIYITLDDVTAANFAAAGRISGVVKFDKPKEVVIVDDEPFAPEEKPQSMKDVVENGVRKPGRPAKADK